MKQVGYSTIGNPTDVVSVMDIEEPDPPGPGEALVAVDAAPINPADLLAMQGRYGRKSPKLPAIGGAEGVGHVLSIGDGVTNVSVGERVSLLLVPEPCWTERIVATARLLVPLPGDADPLQLAMAGGNPMTAWALLHGLRDLEPSDWVIQNAGNSAVAQCVAQLARIAGINVISVVRRPEALDDLVRTPEANGLLDGNDLAQRVAAVTGGSMPVMGYDAVGGAATGRLSSTLVDGGSLIVYGLLSGDDCCVPPRDLVFRDVRLQGFWLATWLRRQQPSYIHEQFNALIEKIRSGELDIPVEATYPLSHAREAVAHAMSSRRGKVLFCPDHHATPRSDS